MKAVPDASSVLLLVKHSDPKELISVAQDMTVLDLLVYEIGNALWKGVTLLKNIGADEASVVHKTLFVFIRQCHELRIDDLDHVAIMKLALEKRLTYYDASYLHVATTLNLPLVTEDGKLSRAARDSVKAYSWKELLGGRVK